MPPSPHTVRPSIEGACACGRLRRASRALTQFYDDALASSGLRVTQFALMRSIARTGAARVSEVARAHLLDRTALSRALGPLVERGYLRVAPGRDARTREVALTRAGERALDGASADWKRAQAAVAKRLGRERLDRLIEALRDLESLHPDAVARSDRQAAT